MLLLNRIPDVIMTACCLHNFILQAGDIREEEYENEDEGDDEDGYGEVGDKALGNAAAQRKRNAIQFFLLH